MIIQMDESSAIGVYFETDGREAGSDDVIRFCIHGSDLKVRESFRQMGRASCC